MLGLADDTGVRMNGGRAGAAEGPGAFRRALTRYGTDRLHDRDWPRVFDAGDVTPGGDIHETHRRVTEAAGTILDLGLFPVAIGGGHDLTFAFVRAAAERRQALRGVSFDAHLDVREEVGSGMPFRALIEQCGVAGVEVFGFSEMANSREHFSWFSEHGGVIRTDRELAKSFEAPGSGLFVSLDLDVIDMAFAPGVSAMNPCGWTAAEAEYAVRQAAACERVRCFDIMELNPAHDEGGRTARLAAHLFLTFLHSFGDRRA